MRTGRSLTICQSLLPGGGWCLLPGRCVCSGGGWAGGMNGVCSGGGWVLLSGGGCLLPGGGIPACTEADPPVNRMNDRQVQKYYLGHNFVAAGKKHECIWLLESKSSKLYFNFYRLKVKKKNMSNSESEFERRIYRVFTLFYRELTVQVLYCVFTCTIYINLPVNCVLCVHDLTRTLTHNLMCTHA